jgi:hypothetical protein
LGFTSAQEEDERKAADPTRQAKAISRMKTSAGVKTFASDGFYPTEVWVV